MLFSWDSNKAEANFQKHGVSFEMAQSVFDDPFHLSILDTKSRSEERWITMGIAADTQTLVVVHTYLDTKNSEIIRLISARKATRKEKKQYEEGI